MAGSSYLVPYNASEASLRGLETALRLANGEKGARVKAVYVVEVDRRLPLDANLPEESERGERCLSAAEELSRKYKTTCDGDILQARDAGHAIVDEAVEMGVQAVVIGVEGGRTQEGKGSEIGRTAEYILRHAPCQVIIVRDAAHG